MSRSKRKAPITPTTTAPSDKPFKRVEHHRERTQIKSRLLVTRDDSALPSPRQFGEPWDGPKDGRQYRGRKAAPNILRK